MISIVKIFFTLVILTLNLYITDPEVYRISNDDFKEVNLEGESLGGWVNNDVLLPNYLVLKDNLLVAIENDLRVNDQLIKIYSLSEKKKIGYYGKSGRGPGEIHGGLQIIHNYNNNNSFSFFDFTSKKISIIDLDRVLEGESYFEPSIFKVLPPNFINLQFGSIISDTLLIGGGYIQEGNLVFSDLENNEYKYTDFKPEIEINFPPILKPNIYISNIAINESKKKIVSANQYFNQIEIFSLNGDLELTISGNDSDQVFQENRNEGWKSEETITYYGGVTTTDKYIMAIYYNKKDHEMRNNDGYYKEDLKSAIRVFDWSGKPIAVLNLDKRVTSINYDEINNRILALDKNSLEPIVAFDFDL